MPAPYESAITSTFSFLSELVTDEDLKAKLEFEEAKLRFELDKTLLSTTTSPGMDSFVKLMIATRDIIIPLFRPLGSLLMAGFAAYCIAKGIMLPEYIQTMLFGAPLAYGTSRHVDKGNQQKIERSKIKSSEYDEDFD